MKPKVVDLYALLIGGKPIVGAHSVQELCSLLKRPRRVMLLVKAGPAVDDFIELLLPHLEKGIAFVT
jgi:6-phosphogluconate dehydrogenase